MMVICWTPNLHSNRSVNCDIESYFADIFIFYVKSLHFYPNRNVFFVAIYDALQET